MGRISWRQLDSVLIQERGTKEHKGGHTLQYTCYPLREQEDEEEKKKEVTVNRGECLEKKKKKKEKEKEEEE
ncbi:hypothetical protein E2C01_101625 [Portunus trituberculatus]|uniref:Uncharacterized protein n=1 Tax=Portunus trituberculatus TaxID=210409 RepID=A0A5B7KG67_PORTR|nr:hypothetical protein [Portunus trituberculatus]